MAFRNSVAIMDDIASDSTDAQDIGIKFGGNSSSLLKSKRSSLLIPWGVTNQEFAVTAHIHSQNVV